ncbi:MAG: hypothetical protein ABI903_02885 [Actinomycetota bacterium]
MAPSQHIRSPLGTTRTSGMARAAAALLGGALVLSACGVQQAGAAAIVNGTPISDKDVQSVAVQLNALPQVQQKLTPSIVLLNLILAPYVLAEADRTGKGVPEAEVRKVVAKVHNPSPSTMDFVRMQLAIPSLDEASRASILATLGKTKITVNPRYGTFDVKAADILPTSPNWIKPTASPVAK